MIVINNNYKAAMLDAVTNNAPFTAFADALLALYKSAIGPSGSTPLATFTAAECTFPGYARAAATDFAPAFLSDLGRAVANGDVFDFLRTAGAGPAQSVFGYFLLNADADDWILAEELAAPETLTVEGEAYAMRLRLALDSLTA